MNEKELLDEMLSITKGSCDLYMHGTIESSTGDVHATFQNALNETLDMQNCIYNTMENKGWYKTSQVEQQKIEQTKQKFI